MLRCRRCWQQWDVCRDYRPSGVVVVLFLIDVAAVVLVDYTAFSQYEESLSEMGRQKSRGEAKSASNMTHVVGGEHSATASIGVSNDWLGSGD